MEGMAEAAGGVVEDGVAGGVATAGDGVAGSVATAGDGVVAGGVVAGGVDAQKSRGCARAVGAGEGDRSVIPE